MRIRSTSGLLKITCYLLLRHLISTFMPFEKKKKKKKKFNYLSFLAFDDGEGDEFEGT